MLNVGNVVRSGKLREAFKKAGLELLLYVYLGGSFVKFLEGCC